ncbi:MAG: DUF736 domain-containing protein [Pseudomonadota bacterium]
MANALGYVSETKSGFEGALAMMNLSAAIRIEKNREKDTDGKPDYRILAGETSTEIGGGWIRKAKNSGREYVSITLADPQIGLRKIYANLAPVKGKKGRHVILWNPRD